MPTLNWIGKEAVVKHHKEVEKRIKNSVTKMELDEKNAGGLHGDKKQNQ
jgi:adenine-specific DNA-methyltransferase